MAGLGLIVGLGNPGAEHLRNRHNAGFWFVDALATGQGLTFRRNAKVHGESVSATFDGGAVRLLKPATYMNDSGRCVAAALGFWKIPAEQMLVVHDDLDLPAGTARLKFDGGHGGQNGLRDIIARLGHGKFHRLRLGIGHPGHKERVLSWVLGRPSAQDEEAMIDSIAASLQVLPLVVAGKFNEATKQLHTAQERE